MKKREQLAPGPLLWSTPVFTILRVASSSTTPRFSIIREVIFKAQHAHRNMATTSAATPALATRLEANYDRNLSTLDDGLAHLATCVYPESNICCVDIFVDSMTRTVKSYVEDIPDLNTAHLAKVAVEVRPGEIELTAHETDARIARAESMWSSIEMLEVCLGQRPKPQAGKKALVLQLCKILALITLLDYNLIQWEIRLARWKVARRAAALNPQRRLSDDRRTRVVQRATIRARGAARREEHGHGSPSVSRSPSRSPSGAPQLDRARVYSVQCRVSAGIDRLETESITNRMRGANLHMPENPGCEKSQEMDWTPALSAVDAEALDELRKARSRLVFEKEVQEDTIRARARALVEYIENGDARQGGVHGMRALNYVQGMVEMRDNMAMKKEDTKSRIRDLLVRESEITGRPVEP